MRSGSVADTRTALIDAFAEALAKSGYPGVSMNEVAANAGIKKPSLYHHFPGGKEAVYVAVAERFAADSAERITAALASTNDFPDQLTALAQVSNSTTAAAVSFEQRIYDALDHVSETSGAKVRDSYVNAVLAPVSRLFEAATARREIDGDPGFLSMTFLELVRDTTDINAAVNLFLDGARPRT
ncbi:TetR/AcrR family transcriptional regulator [Aeromicrobium chenweiae]|uniref:TetR/AcrR family transcriptional regulator n=1 Tax=Aeromicrobium chenweiae TaxID=2079793 RepID=A0A2S0WLF2_9ACTN|nr:TetR/AcrR family transcriptional regulator [Aeromicrobium chenweiae]AWB92146.1 TetR/AcrR family transcriptional regulator [Aeromicrobium chenweiae]TGN32997.1 TetR/AcrR family transcriptional regulator [Aeromicrobium chenweiae]